MKRKFPILFLSCLLTLCLVTTCFAADAEEYCFSAADFSDGATPEGIFLSQVPNDTHGSIYLGTRLLRAGDVIPAELYSQLTLKPASSDPKEATVVFYPISEGQIAAPTALKIPIGNRKNQAPTAENSSFETYKNIPNTGTLSITDPEGEMLTVNLLREPKRGTVVFQTGSTFTYTPAENKVGKDSFVYTVTDPAGNTSEEATVSIQILKPMDKATYADMNGNSGAFAAVWLREQGLFSGERVAGHLCFGPDKNVTRGEFLAMTMKLLNADAEAETLSTGFADEKETPTWLQPYLVNALKTGMISGVTSDDGMIFRSAANVTKAEAAVMLQNALNLPTDVTSPVFSQFSAVPVWARSSYNALSCAGIPLNSATGAETMNRTEAAKLLYEVSRLLDSEDSVSLPWE